jgi:PAS domain S-box-containing protein
MSSIAGTVDPADAYALALQAVGESLGWRFAAVWEEDDGVLHCVSTWTAGGSASADFARVSAATRLGIGEGLPGRVWRDGEARWVTDAATDDTLPRRAAAASADLHSAIAFPLRSERGVVGVVEVFGPDVREPDDTLLETMGLLGMALGHLVERRRAERSEHATLQRLRATMQAALDAIVTMDHHGRVVEFNAAAEQTFGYRSEEVVGREMAELIVPEDLRDAHRRGLARYLDDEQAVVLDRRIEIDAVDAGGRRFPVELTITRIDVPGPPMFTGYLRDITDRKRAEAELRESRARIVSAGVEARRRLERDLHDGAQQQLVSVAMTLRLAQLRSERGDADISELLDEAATDLGAAIAELRELARGIHPAVLTDGGLDPAIRALARRSPAPVTLGELTQQRFAAAVEATAYFVVSEALTNVARYAAGASATVTAHTADGWLVVVVADDGPGGADPAGGGLRGLADRVAAIGGRLEVDSPTRGGTRIRAELPCAS